MTDILQTSPAGQPIAIVGLACRFPDADDPPALHDMILTGRRAFRRIPPCRADLTGYPSTGPAVRDATQSPRAALIEGWQFNTDRFRIPMAAYTAADPAQWLALETAAQALAGAGFPGAEGLARDRVGVFIGNALGTGSSHTSALRMRWPHVRRVLAGALSAANIPAQAAGQVLRHAADQYLAPLPQTSDDTLASIIPESIIPASIVSVICGYFGFRGGSLAVDGGCASSLPAVTSACLSIISGDIDVALAGGVDLSLDPLGLAGLAGTGALATGDVRVYDENPTGFLPGEGCGMVVLMRTAQARAARLRIYAEIAGWGTSAAGQGSGIAADAAGQLVALRRACEGAGTDPADIQLIEGHGTGTAAGDEAELTALAELHKGARGGAHTGTREAAALGSITANIGHAGAAAGVAGLIKTALALSAGVIPPATGWSTPHPVLHGSGGALRLPRSPEQWPAGARNAGVSTMGLGGLNLHLILRGPSATQSRLGRVLRVLPQRASLGSRPGTGPAVTTSRASDGAARASDGAARASDGAARASDGAARAGDGAARAGDGTALAVAYLLHGADLSKLAATMSRVADIARWLSDGQMQDLACQLARDAKTQGSARVAILASNQDQLARLAGEARALLPGLSGGQLAVRPGIFAADGADGRVTLLISDEERAHVHREGAAQGRAHHRPEAILQSFAALAWLDRLGVQASAAVGHGLGEIAGLAWAGCLSKADATAIAASRAQILTGSGIGTAAADGHTERLAADRLRAAATHFRFAAPRRRLISTVNGRELTSPGKISDLLCAGLAPDGPLEDALHPGIEEALRAGAAGAALLVETGPGSMLAAAASQFCPVPAVTIGTGDGNRDGNGNRDGDESGQAAAAALFAVGALTEPERLFAGRPARPIDIWREQIFITRLDQATQTPAGTRPGAQDPAVGPAGPAASGPSPRPAGAGPGSAAGPASQVTGISPWVRGYTAELRPSRRPAPPADDGPWRLRVAGRQPFGVVVDDLFRDDPDAGRTLAVIGTAAGADSCAAAFGAARDAVGTGQLVVITDGPAMAGFWATLHAEHPSLGITVLRAPGSAVGLRAARRFAAAQPGEFRELVIDTAGRAHEPVMVPAVPPASGGFPLGPDDVVLISRGASGAGLALAQVLACCGAAVAVVGRPGPAEDGEAVTGLERLRGAGARVVYEVIDTADPADMAAAVARIEQRLGPVTAVGHAVGACARAPVTELTEAGLRGHVAAELAALTQLVGGVDAGRLRLIATFGSVVARYGLAGEGLLALASGSLAEHAERLADSVPGCRALHADWAAWAGADLGQRPGLAADLAHAGFSAIPIGEGARLLLRMLGAAGGPARLVVQGRAGVPAPPPIRAGVPAPPPIRASVPAPPPIRASEPEQPLAGRFLEVTRLHYPGVELVCEARLSLRTDPYLADYQADGVPMMPPTMALEAMAQAASVLAGRPLRHATGVSMNAPVVIPAGAAGGQALIRLCALRDSDTVSVVLRCEESGFGVDHLRATFGGLADAPAQDGPASPGTTATTTSTATITSTATTASTATAASTATTASAATTTSAATAASTGAPTSPAHQADGAGIVDGSELYGPICFPSGRFRRVAILPEVCSRSCRALARGADDQPWFAGDREAGRAADHDTGRAADREAGRAADHDTGRAADHDTGRAADHDTGRAADRDADGELILGSPGLSEATLHALQACVPHRRLMPAGCDSVTFSGRQALGVVEIRAAAVPAALAAAIPRQAGGPGMKAGGDGAQQASGPAPISPALPGADVWDVEAVDATGRPLVTWRRLRLRDAGLLPRGTAWPPALLSIYLERSGTALGLDPSLHVVIGNNARAVPTDGGGASSGGRIVAGTGYLKELTLGVRATGAAECGWACAEPARNGAPDTGPGARPWLAEVSAQLRQALAEPPATISARLRAIADCLSFAAAPADCPVTVASATNDGWVLLSAAEASLACAVVEVSGVPCPVAVALMTGSPAARPGRRTRPSSRRSQRGPSLGTSDLSRGTADLRRW